MLGDVLKVLSETLQHHSIAIAWLRTIDGGGGLSTLPVYVASFTAALSEIVKAYPIVQEMIETEIRGQEWDKERHRRSDKLIQYFNSINTLTIRIMKYKDSGERVHAKCFKILPKE